MRLNRLIISIISIIGLAFTMHALTPDEILNRSASKLTRASGISFRFEATGDNALKGMFKGTGEKFAMTTDGGAVWYNGTHMWTYNKHSEETTQVVPTVEELVDSNPLAYISAHANEFTASAGQSTKKGEEVVVLMPKKRDSEVQRVVLTINSKTMLPVKVAIRRSEKTIVIKISDLTLGGVYPETMFNYPASKYPGVPVVKL